MTVTLITGGAGFIGSHLTRKLVEKGEEVIVYDNSVSYSESLKTDMFLDLKMRLGDIEDRFVLVRGDVQDLRQLFEVIKRYQPERIVHMAAIPLPRVANKTPGKAISMNIIATANVLEASRQIESVKRVVYTSSSFVYGNFQYEPADEKHPTLPIDIYGSTKLAGENIARGYAASYGMDVVIIRPSAVYGPTDVNERVVQLFLENALQGKPLVVSDGANRLDFTYVSDTASGFSLALDSPRAKGETFNITRGEGRSIKELATIIQELIPGTKIVEGPSQKAPKRGALDISKARSLLGYAPQYRLEEGLKSYLNWMKLRFTNKQQECNSRQLRL